MFRCRSCPYKYDIQKKIVNPLKLQKKEVDDILGGEDAWENVDSTEIECPKCSHLKAFFMQIQTRSADEPMTTFYKCAKRDCGNVWNDK